jgi:regulatory protein
MMLRRRSPRSIGEEHRTGLAAARTAAIALLARRDFASNELREKLRAQGFDDGTAAAVIAELTRSGTVSDERYAQNYVAYHAGRGQGPLRIAAQLRRHGLAPAAVDAALARGPDWSTLATKVCRAKFGPEPPSSWSQKARQARFLQYRGFSSDHIRAATGADPDTGLADV